jgi:hypothetical protein
MCAQRVSDYLQLLYFQDVAGHASFNERKTGVVRQHP